MLINNLKWTPNLHHPGGTSGSKTDISTWRMSARSMRSKKTWPNWKKNRKPNRHHFANYVQRRWGHQSPTTKNTSDVTAPSSRRILLNGKKSLRLSRNYMGTSYRTMCLTNKSPLTLQKKTDPFSQLECSTQDRCRRLKWSWRTFWSLRDSKINSISANSACSSTERYAVIHVVICVEELQDFKFSKD